MIRTGPIGHRVTILTRRLIGFGIVVAGWSIMFINVSTNKLGIHEACGTAWRAMFSQVENSEYECGEAAWPLLWIGGAVFAVGMCVAFWDGREDRIRRLLSLVGLAVFLTLVIAAAGFVFGRGPGGE